MTGPNEKVNKFMKLGFTIAGVAFVAIMVLLTANPAVHIQDIANRFGMGPPSIGGGVDVEAERRLNHNNPPPRKLAYAFRRRPRKKWDKNKIFGIIFTNGKPVADANGQLIVKEGDAGIVLKKDNDFRIKKGVIQTNGQRADNGIITTWGMHSGWVQWFESIREDGHIYNMSSGTRTENPNVIIFPPDQKEVELDTPQVLAIITSNSGVIFENGKLPGPKANRPSGYPLKDFQTNGRIKNGKIRDMRKLAKIKDVMGVITRTGKVYIRGDAVECKGHPSCK